MNRQERIAAAMKAAGLDGTDPDAPVTLEQYQAVVSYLEAQPEPTPSATTTSSEPRAKWVTPDDRPSRQVAVEILIRDEKLSREEALEVVALSPDIETSMAHKIAEDRDYKRQAAEYQAKKLYEQSPEYAREAAKAALAAEAEQEQLAKEAAALLRARGDFDPTDPPEAMIKAAGLLEREPDPAYDLQANIDRINADDAKKEQNQ
jgi:hypothetical protein